MARFGRKLTKDEPMLHAICRSIDRVFGRCKKSIMECHEDGWHLLLSWLRSSKKDGYDPEPFSVYYEKSTHEKYIDYWKRFFCYCVRLMDEEVWHGVKFIDGQL